MRINFPSFGGVRCLMMPYIQGHPPSLPEAFDSYSDIIRDLYVRRGDIGFLTIDESVAIRGNPHRGVRAKTSRALHTEAGRHPDKTYQWGGGGWGSSHRVTLAADVEILIASNLDDSCAVWDSVHEDTSLDGDIGHASADYPYCNAKLLKAGEVARIGILTPHESLPVNRTINRQFLRIVSAGVYGREPYFTENPVFEAAAT